MNKLDSVRGKPPFAAVYNPAKRNKYTFRAKFARDDRKKGLYVAHSRPAGAQVVPANGSGQRIAGRCEFTSNI